jgi:hypothetical protein
VTEFGELPTELMSKKWRAIFKAIELDLAPSLMVFSLAAVLGMFKFFCSALLALSILGASIIAHGYVNEQTGSIKTGRIIIVVSTLMVFLLILMSTEDIGTAIRNPLD